MYTLGVFSQKKKKSSPSPPLPSLPTLSVDCCPPPAAAVELPVPGAGPVALPLSDPVPFVRGLVRAPALCPGLHPGEVVVGVLLQAPLAAALRGVVQVLSPRLDREGAVAVGVGEAAQVESCGVFFF